MTKDQYELLKAEIINKYGVPVRDTFSPELNNESANKLNALKGEYLNSCRAASLDAKRILRAKNESLKEIAADIKPRGVDDPDYIRRKPDPCYVMSSDLLAFDEKEKDIIVTYFENQSLTPHQLSNQFGMSRQKVMALLNSPAFKVIYSKVYDRLLPIESLMAIRAKMKDGDSKVILEVARNYGLIKNEGLDITNRVKPIEDPEAIKLLKELGNRMSQ